MGEVIPFPKTQRIVNPHAGIVKVRDEARCRGCGQRLLVHRSHLVGKGAGGDDVNENIIPLCGSGTTGCHGLLHSHAHGWTIVAARVRASLRPEEEAYILRRKGEDWIDAHYPPAVRQQG